MKQFPLFPIKSIVFDWAKSAGIVVPVLFDRRAELRVAVSAIRNIKVWVIAIVRVWAVAMFIHFLGAFASRL